MGYIVLTIAAVILTVIFTRGRWQHLVSVKMRHLPLLAIGIGLQVLASATDAAFGPSTSRWISAYLISALILIAFCAMNRPKTWMLVVSCGIAFNAIAVGANQGMPTRTPDGRGPIVTTAKHRPAESSDRVVLLTDIIWIPAPASTMISLGDLMISVGVCGIAYSVTRRQGSGELVRAPIPKSGPPS